jgi:hypothetical protein
MSLSHQPPGPVKMRNPLGWWWHTPHDKLDKIDPNNLVRDTRVYVHAVGRLLADPVLPVDYAAHATALMAELCRLEGVARHGIRIERLLTLAAKLRNAAAALPSPEDAAAAARQDAALMRAARVLVPLDYTSGDRFSHDPALPQPPWPALEPLRRLAAAEPGTHQAHLLAVAARRACNRFTHALDRAHAALTFTPG